MKERGDLSLQQTQKMCQMVAKHVLLMRAKHSTLEMKHFVKDRRNALLTMTIQVMGNNAERGEHVFPNSRISTFSREACAKYQRSRIDSENWEPPRLTRSSKRSTTKSSIWRIQFGTKEHDSGSVQHRIVRIARHGSQNAMHSMPILLERRHRLLYMRAFLSERNRGQSKIRSIYNGSSFSPWICDQEGKISRPQIWEKARRQLKLFGQLIEEEMQKEKFPRNSWSFFFWKKSWDAYSNDWKQLRWSSLTTMGFSCRWRSHLTLVRKRIPWQQEQMVAAFK